MTACNLIVESNRAIFITDTAVIHGDWRVSRFGPKIVAVPRFSFAMAVTGSIWDEGVLWFNRWFAQFNDQGRALASIPQLAATARNFIRVNAEGCAEAEVMLAVAYFDEDAGRMDGKFVSTTDAGMQPGYRPGAFVRVRELLSPWVDLPRPDGFDVETYGRQLLERQRRIPVASGHYAIGGEGVATIVDRWSVRHVPLCKWDDRIGEPIRPA